MIMQELSPIGILGGGCWLMGGNGLRSAYLGAPTLMNPGDGVFALLQLYHTSHRAGGDTLADREVAVDSSDVYMNELRHNGYFLLIIL
jgi:hypothetical protein